jgi:23S rRNA (uracil1939-C5)-methyltransferase
MTPDLLTIKLEKLTYGGDALGRLPDGRAVFVPFGLPGEEVRLRLVDEKRGHARAELVEVLRGAPGRIAPRCPHFGVCGGCAYQHLPYTAQLQAKTDILRDQLVRIGKLPDPPLQPIVPSPQEWNYRNHVQFHLDRSGRLGFEAPHSQRVVSITECHLPEAPLNALWPQLTFDPGLGIERVAMRLGEDGQVLLALESPDPRPPELEIEADISVVHLFEGDSVVLAGEDGLSIGVEAHSIRRSFQVSAAAFFQVNTAMAGMMVAHLLDRLPLASGVTLLDVYCGGGLFSAFLAGRVGRLIGIEASPAACQDFAVNLDEFDNVELYEAPAEDVLPALEVVPEIVLVDPPRSGLERRALEAILERGPGTLAYVSCDPSTLGRDAARLLAGGYRLVEVTPFDLFPQTASIESISIFQKG